MARSALLRFAFSLACLSIISVSLQAQQNARFDLAGPKIDVRVTRDGRALPIAMVPNLLSGDHLWLHADLPETQSVHYLLVAVFLRGTTNPPPEDWIVKIETWNKRVRAEGQEIVVPPGAEQVLLLLAPETGGDISALRSAVRGHPGVFVRASQDLAEAGFEQARIEKYLAEIKNVPPDDAKALAEHSDLLARTLNLKPNVDCFKRPVDQQYGCLSQSGSQSLLDDGHGNSIVNSLTTGASSDLISAASTTSLAGSGVYSAYVGAIVDVVRIMGNLHTAHYQYIPAIAFPKDKALNLRLNAPPSFQNPKSVIVIGLPAVQKATAPPLRASDPKHITCLLQPAVALPVEGAPLVFSTSFAHDISLHRDLPPKTLDVPLTADAFQGGLVFGQPEQRHALPEDSVPAPAPPLIPVAPDTPVQESATVNGMWGFEVFHGPTLTVQNLPGSDWKLAMAAAADHLIVGEKNELVLSSTGTACISGIALQQDGSPDQKLEWTQGDKPNTVATSFTLPAGNPGSIRLRVNQYGGSPPVNLSMRAFSKPAHISAIDYHLGDAFLVVSGQGLGELKQVSLGDTVFSRVAPASAPGTAPEDSSAGVTKSENTLRLAAAGATAPAKLSVGEALTASAVLNDGREIPFPITVEGSRPNLAILSRKVNRPQGSETLQLLNPDDIPLDGTLMLSLRAGGRFPRDGQIQITNDDNSISDTLTLENGSLVLQDRSTVVGHIDLQKTFGISAFGPLRIRLVLQDGTAGDWMPLATLVRLPQLGSLTCAATGDLPCALSGTALYLVNAVSADQAFTHPVLVPEGFVGQTLMTPRPVSGTLYLRLRDDPASVVAATLPSAATPSTSRVRRATEPAATDPAL